MKSQWGRRNKKNIGLISGKVNEGDEIKNNFWPILKKGNEGDKKKQQKKYLLSLKNRLVFFRIFISRNLLFFSKIGNNLMRALGR